jgi:hypothetical protein
MWIRWIRIRICNTVPYCINSADYEKVGHLKNVKVELHGLTELMFLSNRTGTNNKLVSKKSYGSAAWFDQNW